MIVCIRFYKFTASFTECLLFLCRFNLLFVCFICNKQINIIEHTYNALLVMVSDVKLRKATFLLDNRTPL